MLSRRSIRLKHTTIKVVVFCACVAALVGVEAHTAGAALSVTEPDGNEVVSESADYAIQRFADPWDMTQRTDLSHGRYMNQLKNVKFRDGIFSARTTGTDAQVYPLFPGYLGGLANGRDGKINKINTSAYRRFSIRMYSSRATQAQVIWLYNQVFTSFGVKTFHVDSGWNVYNVDITTRGDWTGKPMGLRFDPTNHNDVALRIDWIKLYGTSGARVDVGWTDSAPGGLVNIYLDNDMDPNNGNLGLVASQTSAANNSYSFDPAPYAAGTYYFYFTKSGQSSVYSGALTVNRPPLTTILNPDETGGRDYATAVGVPWNMNSSNAVTDITNIRDVTFNNGIMTGVTQNSDGFFHLNTPVPIDTNRYHRLSFRYRYDGSFNYGLGTMARFIWSPDRHNLSLYQTLKDVVSYPQWTTYVVDLKKAPLSSGTIRWNGNMTVFRFDPLEVPSPRRIYVDFIRLADDDRADRRFTIKWRDARTSPRTTHVSFYRDTNRGGYDGQLIVANRLQTSGENQYRWNTSGVPAGTYYVYIVADDGVSVIRRYSSGPVKIAH